MKTGYRGMARLLLSAAGLLLASGAGWAQQLAETETASAAPTVEEAHNDLSDESCNNCHAPTRIPIVDPEMMLKSAHKDTECAECHSDIEDARHNGDLQPVVCDDCHKKEVKHFKTSVHGQAHSKADAERQAAKEEAEANGGHYVAAEAGPSDKKEPPVCVDCHGAHDVAEVESVAFREVIASRCKQCHEERFETYMDRFHGKAAVLGMVEAPRCHDCHTGHKQLPADDAKSTVHADNLVETCSQCHEKANENFTEFDPHPQPHNKEHSALVYYWWLFMVALIVGTFAFFGLHDLLWLQRIVGAYIRKEVPPRKAPEGPWVRRFTPVQSSWHVVLNITFMLLALTGLPLMYAQADWAKQLATLFGNQPVMRYVHFAAAAVFFGGFLTHLIVVFYKAFTSKGFGMFWGVNSLVPWGPDFADMWKNFKWFLYMGERPELDRWTYWEKFDYWAVFWGMAIIGISGVMMANAELYARVLPGEWLNVAAVIHGEEALLAVGFITFFHFFHNHLRPENFPMDITVFTGRQPLERMKEERPRQYERAVREGTLDSMIVPPPSPLATALWTIYGSILIFLGIFLTVAVIYTILF